MAPLLLVSHDPLLAIKTRTAVRDVHGTAVVVVVVAVLSEGIGGDVHVIVIAPGLLIRHLVRPNYPGHAVQIVAGGSTETGNMPISTSQIWSNHHGRIMASGTLVFRVSCSIFSMC